ncbi:MAG TPA: hypothetical protein VNM92_18100 [Thermoanaerobaculia bacterium]|nr:hypothetical protein [Thermoanaerobaculia bacterium]
MLLFQKRFHEGLINGSVTLTFRRWPKARVKPGGRYRCHPIGVLDVTALSRVPVSAISESDALQAGLDSRDELLAYMAGASDEPMDESTEVFRVELHYGGDGDRVSIALDSEISNEELEGVRTKLTGYDSRSKVGPWTGRYLELIKQYPRVAASKLAAMVERDKADFKADIVKLKKLGLTQSFEVGYEISPRGLVVLSKVPSMPVG